jgi:hypothetical protein
MNNEEKPITLDEAIAHFEAIDKCAKQSGVTNTNHGHIAKMLRRLRTYEEAIEKGELIWKNEKRYGKRN